MRDVARGDTEAFALLYARYAPIATALARRILRQRNLAEETVQEAFLAVWRHPDRYLTHRGSVRSWLLSIVHHRAVDLVRREESQRTRAAHLMSVTPTDCEPTDPGEVVVQVIGTSEEREAVRRALEHLPPEQRQIIDLMYFGGLSQTQISERLCLPLGTVKSRTLLGMRRLRAALGGLKI